jgi:Flp pilus assembly protein protease CpaA
MIDAFVIDIILVCIGFIALIIGSCTDIKTREVPDWLNFALIACALGLRLIYSILSFDFSYFLYGLLGFGIFFAIAYAMFYSGQWGGGDSKMLMGVGALIGTYPEFLLKFFSPDLSFGLPFAFFLNLLFVGSFYGLSWSIFLAVKNWKSFSHKWKEFMSNKILVLCRKVLLAVMVLAIISLFLVKDLMIQFLVFAFVFVSVLTFYVWIFVKCIENSCMYKHYPVEKLTEGDWVVENVFVKGKKIFSSTKTGIEKKDIEKLKSHHVRQVLVKEGIPFVPSFLIAFVLTLIFGNLLFLFVGF